MNFTVLQSVYKNDNPNFLSECFHSIAENSILPESIILIKDGVISSELEEVISQWREHLPLHVVGYEENKGLAHALNYGIQFATTELTARTDSDGICSPDRFEKQPNYFDSHQNTKHLTADRLQISRLPKYSVLMSVYHKEKAEYLKESLDSILRQTVMPSEIVIVCDGPLTEALDQVLAEKCQEYPELFDIVHLKKQMGLGGALNIGMKHCHFEYIARMDSDDISCEDRMEQQLNAMQQQKADIASGTVAEFTKNPTAEGKLRRLPETAEEILQFSRRRNPFNHPCVMYKKSVVQKAGGYQPFEGFEDYCLWLRMLRCGAVGYNLNRILLYMRTKGMYKRRGGLKYAGRILRFRGYMFRNKFCTLGDYLFTVIGHVGVSLLPDSLRRMFYNKILRK